FDLQCEHGHVFEGWFASADAYESQKDAGLLSCPVCNSSSVNRKVSAARLNIGHLKRERLEQGPSATPSSLPASAGAAAAGGMPVAQPLPADTREIARLQ